MAVVVIGSVFLRLVRPPSSDRSASDGSKESSERRRKKLAQDLEVVQSLFQQTATPARPPAPPPAANPPQASPDSIFDVRCPVCGQTGHDNAVPRKMADSFAFFEFHHAAFYEDLPRAFQPLPNRTWYERIGNGLFGFPDRLLDASVDLFRGLLPDSPTNVVDLDEQGILERFFADVEHTRGGGDAFVRFLNNLADQEVSYFSRFWEMRTIPEEFQDESILDGVDPIREQLPIVLRALQRTYFDRFRTMGDRARDAAHHLDRWRGLDFVVAPALIVGSAWFAGIDRRFSIGPTRGWIHLEPVRDLVRGSEAIVALGLEWGWKDFPIRLLISCGWIDGEPGVDFIGIGTDLGQVKKILELAAGR